AAAQVGKGTLYIYFKSKEDLYVSLVSDGFAHLVQQLENVAELPPQQALTQIIRQLVIFSFAHPNFFEMMRTVPQLTNHSSLLRMRKELSDLITKTLRRGVRQGIWSDPHPELTAIIIPGMLRSAMLYGPRELDEQVLIEHILHLVFEGIGRGNGK
ncbi:MAG TPA: TetR/AcrR family transcriptional regulator, partial [Tepidisphaeraceae bacterium]|nr:TetR/AcrR family transcriptional regulator [Tepidisphaeraceae bacterium]